MTFQMFCQGVACALAAYLVVCFVRALPKILLGILKWGIILAVIVVGSGLDFDGWGLIRTLAGSLAGLAEPNGP